jgi:hypothetical protein
MNFEQRNEIIHHLESKYKWVPSMLNDLECIVHISDTEWFTYDANKVYRNVNGELEWDLGNIYYWHDPILTFGRRKSMRLVTYDWYVEKFMRC